MGRASIWRKIEGLNRRVRRINTLMFQKRKQEIKFVVKVKGKDTLP